MERPEDQLRRYHEKSGHNKRWFQSLKVAQNRGRRREALLAARVEALVSQEHAAWADTQRIATEGDAG